MKSFLQDFSEIPNLSFLTIVKGRGYQSYLSRFYQFLLGKEKTNDKVMSFVKVDFDLPRNSAC